jgi:hypothetical protein
MQLDESSAERAWRITAPVTIDGKVVGALRGLFSVKEYDDLIGQEIALTQMIGIGVVLLTSLVFLLLIASRSINRFTDCSCHADCGGRRSISVRHR